MHKDGTEFPVEISLSPFQMDGQPVVIASIRERERRSGGHLWVIAATARSRKEDRDRCLAAGVDDFITKPIRNDALGDVLDRASRHFEDQNSSG